MADEHKLQMTPLDEIAALDLQIIKAAIPYVPSSEQKTIAVYVKMMELMNTIQFFDNASDDDMKACALSPGEVSTSDMLNDMRNYCTGPQRDMLDNCMNMMNAMDMYRMFQETMGSSTGEEGDASNPMGNMDILKSFLSPEQQSMFEAYSSMMDDDTYNENNDQEE